MFLRVFSGFFGGRAAPATFSQPNFGQGGVVFLDFKGKIVFGDPLASNSDPPLRGKVCLKKHPRRDLRLGLDPQ